MSKNFLLILFVLAIASTQSIADFYLSGQRTEASTQLIAGNSFHTDFEDIKIDADYKSIDTPKITNWQFSSYYQVYDVEAYDMQVPQGHKALYLNSGEATRVIENIRPNRIYTLKIAIAANDAKSAKESFVALQAVKGISFDTLQLVRFSDVLNIDNPKKFKYAELSFDASTREDLKGYPLRIVVISKTMIHFDDVTMDVKTNNSSNVLTLENDHVSFVFLGKNRGLASLYDKKNNQEHINRVPGPGWYDKPLTSTLWKIQFVNNDKKETLTSQDFPCSNSNVETDKDGNKIATIIWKKLSLKNSSKSVNVEVRITLPKDSGIASWEINIDNKSCEWGLHDIKFPYVTGLLEAKKYNVAAPRKNIGMNYKDCDERLFFEYGEGWWGPGQFMCADLNNKSVYMAIHDKEGWAKNYVCDPGKEFFVQSFPENTDKAGSDFKAPYPVMLGVFKGNWLTACKIYRNWAIENANWLKQGNVKKSSIPQSIKDVAVWTIVGDRMSEDTPVDDMIKPIYDLQKKLEAKIGVHWYNWHDNIFDNKLPHYLPAKPYATESIKRFAGNKDFLVMPYINARVISIDIDDYERFVPYLCLDENGKPYTELYGPAPNTEVMCPYTKMWQDEIYNITKQIVEDLDVRAIYLDQVSGAPIKLCYDKSHGHPLGGGDWWVESYHKMLAKLRTIGDSDGDPIAITTEFAAEPYVGATDAFLVWMTRGPEDLPMLPAVYSGYTFYFGSNNYEAEEQTWKLVQLRSAIWGIQNGWMSPAYILDPTQPYRSETLKMIADLRQNQAKKYLTDGELVDIIDSNDEIEVTWNGKKVKYPATQTAIWKYDDNSFAALIANYSDSRKQVELEISLDKYLMSNQKSSLKFKKIVGSGKIGFVEIIASHGKWQALHQDTKDIGGLQEPGIYFVDPPKDEEKKAYDNLLERIRQQDPRDMYEPFTHTSASGESRPCRLLKPENYDPTKKYPLIFLLHQSGLNGSDNEKQIMHNWVPRLMSLPESRVKYPCFVLAPQAIDTEIRADFLWDATDWWNPTGSQKKEPTANMRIAFEILDKVIKDYSIDFGKVYVAGESMGGYGTFEAVARRPHFFAAAVPVCGGYDYALGKLFADTPMWIIHGEIDEIVPAERGRKMAGAILEAGGKPIYWEYNGINHYRACDMAWGSYKVLDWMFAQTRTEFGQSIPKE